jgi:hypothetical protein
MLDDFKELVEATYQLTNISTGLIEKDYYITDILHILSLIKNKYFNLVFAGGTCLAKAHKITKRMSEDIDFKLQPYTSLPIKKQRKEFSNLREEIITELSKNFICEAKPTEGRNTHVKIHIQYPTLFPKDPNVRPYILLELTITEIKIQTFKLSVDTLIKSTLGNKVKSQDCALECVSIEETATEKWVALTRRIAETTRYPFRKEDNSQALVRHIYDLFIIIKENKLGHDFVSLAKEIINYDKIQFKDRHTEYFKNPISEIQYSLSLLKEEKYKNSYAKFIESLVYSNTLIPNYEEALTLIEEISQGVINSISPQA